MVARIYSREYEIINARLLEIDLNKLWAEVPSFLLNGNEHGDASDMVAITYTPGNSIGYSGMSIHSKYEVELKNNGKTLVIYFTNEDYPDELIQYGYFTLGLWVNENNKKYRLSWNNFILAKTKEEMINCCFRKANTDILILKEGADLICCD